MAGTYTYPGVYVEEIPSGVRTITGVSTSDTAFIDIFLRGPVNKAVRCTSYADFERQFGGLDSRSEGSYAIQQYYLNGGTFAWVIRVTNNAQTARRRLEDDNMTVQAANAGRWGNNLQVGVDYKGTRRDPVTNEPVEFNLVVREVVEVRGRKQVLANEIYRNLSVDPASPRFIQSVINGQSSLITIDNITVDVLPQDTGADVISVIGDITSTAFLSLGPTPAEEGSDGIAPEAADLIGSPTTKTGIYALDDIQPFIFNILCIPALANLADVPRGSVITEAKKYCLDNRAMVILDIPVNIDTPAEMITLANGMHDDNDRNAAVYFPRVQIPDPLNEYRLRNVGPSGTLAGVYARTDAVRGVWKAPAGTDAGLQGASPVVLLDDQKNGDLNQMGINVLRTFPIFGSISWGARTLEGADQQASEWKYIPVRRTALFIEESLYQGLKWVVFEPNDEPLWSQIRLNVGAFMHDLFRRGAFQGATPKEAYFVKCDKDTTTQNDIDRGIVNILVGFAPLKPAEFVVIKIQQIAGQVQV
ncbi:MAG TPA: phage tail sheath C-terminal domain-containing protein [Chloroflexia bacterium]|nr:phage tail sheath C-terminal domain-containing protein [Chloroflexia bacterium]